ncbi:hypothetical protein SOVF_207880 [Spinacia oleracea]|nr:hypothetical protein SOVF_207880 [Spinacia oleracea]
MSCYTMVMMLIFFVVVINALPPVLFSSASSSSFEPCHLWPRAPPYLGSPAPLLGELLLSLILVVAACLCCPSCFPNSLRV